MAENILLVDDRQYYCGYLFVRAGVWGVEALGELGEGGLEIAVVVQIWNFYLEVMRLFLT